MTDVIQVDPEFNPEMVMGPKDTIPRNATPEERVALGLEQPTHGGKPRVEEEAREAVDGPRGHHYGPPQVNHERTAILWQAYIYGKYDIHMCFTPEDVCYFNNLQKISRDMNNPTRDNLVDQIGYILNIAKLREED